jgi:hypothetical protein
VPGRSGAARGGRIDSSRRCAARYSSGMVWKRAIFVLALIAVGIAGWRIAIRGERLETRLLRAGGRVVQAAVERPKRTLTIFGLALGSVWCGVGIAVLASRRRRGPSVPKMDRTRTGSSEPHRDHESDI